MIQAGRYFSLSEITRACGGSLPPAEFHANVNKTVQFLDTARAILGVPLLLTDLWRDQAENDRLKSEGYSAAKNSQHMRGLGADVCPVGISPYLAAQKLIQAQSEGRLPAFHQIIVYDAGDLHIHFGLAGESWAADLQQLFHENSGKYVALTKAKLSQLVASVKSNPGKSTAVALLVMIGVGLAFFFPATSAGVIA